MKFLAVLILLSFSVYADEADELAKKLETMPAAQRAEVLQIMMMKAQMNREDSRITPELTITGQEGFKFKTQNPVVAEMNAEEIWAKFKNPTFTKPAMALHPLLDPQKSVFEYLNSNEKPYRFRFYNFGSEFTIKHFIHAGSKWMFIVSDIDGQNLLIDNEYDLDRMLEGDRSRFDGDNALIIDWLLKGQTKQKVRVVSFLSGLDRFIEDIKSGGNRHFPIIKQRTVPTPEPKSKAEWLNYFLRETINKQAIISNEKVDGRKMTYEIEADTDVLAFLVYSHFFRPDDPNFKHHDAYSRHAMYQNQDESKVIQNTLYYKRKRSKEEQEEFLRFQQEIKKRNQ